MWPYPWGVLNFGTRRYLAVAVVGSSALRLTANAIISVLLLPVLLMPL
jgi:hypothetical protein